MYRLLSVQEIRYDRNCNRYEEDDKKVKMIRNINKDDKKDKGDINKNGDDTKDRCIDNGCIDNGRYKGKKMVVEGIYTTPPPMLTPAKFWRGTYPYIISIQN